MFDAERAPPVAATSGLSRSPVSPGPAAVAAAGPTGMVTVPALAAAFLLGAALLAAYGAGPVALLLPLLEAHALAPRLAPGLVPLSLAGAIAGLGARRCFGRSTGVAAERGQGSRRRAAVLLLLAALTGALHFALAAAAGRATQLPTALDGVALMVSGRVAGPVRCAADGCRWLLREARARNGATLPSRIRVHAPAALPRPRPGQRATLALKLRVPRGLRNPASFDYERWLFAEGIGALATVLPHGGNALLAGRATLRQRLRARLSAHVAGHRVGSLVLALGLGERSAMPDALSERLRRTGTSHLLALSGLHVGLVAVLGMGLGRGLVALTGLWRTPWGWPLALGCGLSAAVAYGALAGFPASVLRALAMALLAAAALLTRARLVSLSRLTVALAAIVLCWPRLLLGSGLWLSALAVAALLLFLAGRLRPPHALALTMVGAVLMMPASAALFGTLSVVAPLANLVAIPVVALVLVPGSLVLAVWVSLPLAWTAHGPLAGLGDLVLFALDGTWRGLDALLATLASAAFAQLPVGRLGMPGALGLALLVLLLFVPLPRPSRLALALPVVLMLAVGRPAGPPRGVLQATLFDVGQGQALLLRTAHHALLYDTGGAHDGRAVASFALLPALARSGIAALDAVILSHRDLDHRGGAAALAAALPVRRWLSNPAFAAEQGMAPCEAGAAWDFDGVHFRFLHPPAGSTLVRNNASCVLLVESAGGRRLLVTGDIEAPVEVALAPMVPRVDVLTVPHHGSKTSSSEPFLAALAPTHALNASGHRNRWAFPHAPVVARYEAQGIEVWDTARSGALRLTLGAEVRVTPATPRGRAWREPLRDRAGWGEAPGAGPP